METKCVSDFEFKMLITILVTYPGQCESGRSWVKVDGPKGPQKCVGDQKGMKVDVPQKCVVVNKGSKWTYSL